MLLHPVFGTRIKPAVNTMREHHPLVQGLEIATAFPEGPAQFTRNVVKGDKGTFNGTLARHSLYGGGPKLDGTNGQYVSFVLPSSLSGQVPVTISWIGKLDVTPALKNCFNISTSGGSILLGYWWDSTGNGFLVQNWLTSNNSANATQLSRNPTITIPHHWHVSWDGVAARAKIWVDAVDISANGSSGLSHVNNNSVEIGRGATGFNGAASYTGVWVWRRMLLPCEIRAHFLDPWFLWEQEEAWWPNAQAAAGRTTKNTRAFPLGLRAGMGRRISGPFAA